MNKINLLRCLFWFIPLGFEFVLEFVALIKPGLGIPPLTALIRKMPMWAVFVILCWFWWHFLIRYYLPAPHDIK